jgi:hypothetical protein
MQWDRKSLIRLRSLLVPLYPFREDVLRIAKDAGLDVGLLTLSGSVVNIWFFALEQANAQGKVRTIAELALNENLGHRGLEETLKGTPPGSFDEPEDGPGLQWKAAFGAAQAEKVLGPKSALVSVRYLEEGIARARPVGMVDCGMRGSGTGFLVWDGLFLTNNHVLPSQEEAAVAHVDFNFQEAAGGLSAKIDRYALQPEALFMTSVEDDWTIVAIDRKASDTWGTLPLNAREVLPKERVNIIQHPSGAPKQLSYFHNLVTYADGKRLQYLTDTLPGSSGAPVFDAQWRVVGLHARGGWLTEPGGSRLLYRNEGIHVTVLVEALRSACAKRT